MLRAEVAANLGDQSLALKLLNDLHRLSLDASERSALVAELETAHELTQMLK